MTITASPSLLRILIAKNRHKIAMLPLRFSDPRDKERCESERQSLLAEIKGFEERLGLVPEDVR